MTELKKGVRVDIFDWRDEKWESERSLKDQRVYFFNEEFRTEAYLTRKMISTNPYKCSILAEVYWTESRNGGAFDRQYMKQLDVKHIREWNYNYVEQIIL